MKIFARVLKILVTALTTIDKIDTEMCGEVRMTLHLNTSVAQRVTDRLESDHFKIPN